MLTARVLTRGLLVSDSSAPSTRDCAGAKACLESSSALRLAQKLAAKVKLSTGSEAGQAVESLLNYYHILLRLAEPLGADARDRRVLSIQWRSAWDPSAKFKHHALSLEIASVLFNLAAAFSARGALAQGADDVESIKRAARDFQLAAGALAEAEALSPHAALGAACTDDLADACLAALRELMLAQAQACVCSKAEADAMGGALRCKLMAGASQAYQRAAAALDTLELAGGRLEKLGSGKRAGADFAAVAGARGSYYEASARWQAAQDAADAGKHGLQQAQLQLAAAAAAAAAAAGQASLPEPGRAKAAALQARVLEQLAMVRRCLQRRRLGPAQRLAGREACMCVCARAVYACSMRVCSCSDNELVYYEAVPSESSLEPLEPKILVKPLPLAPLLAPLDGRRVPPQLLSRGEGDELLMCELFQARHTPFTYTPLRYTPRVSVQPLAAPCSPVQPLVRE